MCESNIIRIPKKNYRTGSVENPVGSNLLIQEGQHHANSSAQFSDNKVLSSAPGLRDLEEANKDRNIMVDGIVSPQSSHKNKVVFSEANDSVNDK